MNRALRRILVRVGGLARLAAVSLGFAAAGPALAQTGYLVEDLGALPGDSGSVAWAINARGDVVGWSNGPNGTRAFLYTDAGGMVPLPGLPDRPRTVARDINDRGDVVGSANAGGVDLGHAVLWPFDGPVQDLGTLGTGAYSEAWGVNDLRQVAGWSHVDGGSFPVHAFLHTPDGGLVDLTPASDTGYATDINDAGEVTGYKTAVGGYHAFRWQAGTFVDLGVLPGLAHSFGWAINPSGRVAGNSTSASGSTERFVRSLDGGGLQDLGGAGEHNVAWGINASGQVVGSAGRSQTRAVVFTDAGGLRDLNTLIDPSLGWVLLGANDVNDAGQIVGYAFNNHTTRTHGVRLSPTTASPPACTFQCLRATGLELQGRFLRRPRSYAIRASVHVDDENGSPVATAMLLARWTHPDGSQYDQFVTTSAEGVATLATEGRGGTYILTIVNVQKPLFTFDPENSTLEGSLTVAGKLPRGL